MTLPLPQPGLVICYSYLWAEERDQDRDEGVKDRPCGVLLATRIVEGDLRVIVLPITHAPPTDQQFALEIPAAAKRRLGLDEVRTWIVLTEGNAFAWPGPDLRFKAGAGPESVALGLLPDRLFKAMRDGFLALHEKRKARFASRTE